MAPSESNVAPEAHDTSAGSGPVEREQCHFFVFSAQRISPQGPDLQSCVWREPFVQLRVPLLFNLRRDPYERAQHNANTYNDWFLDRAFVIIPITELAGKFLKTMVDYPPSATAGSFNLSKMQKQIESMAQSH